MNARRLPHRLALLAMLGIAAAAHAGPIECRTGKTEFLAGTAAHPGTHYATATGMDVAAPVRPEDWTLQRCNSGTIFFAHADAPHQLYVTAMVSDVGIAPWSDESAFEAKVLDVVTSSEPPIQHMKIDEKTATTVDGRPCFDIRRSGTVDSVMTAAGPLVGPLASRDFIRACHLRDKRGPQAAVLVVYKAVGAHDMPDFGDAARAYVDGVTLPRWMH
jgi:hypothetical protein